MQTISEATFSNIKYVVYIQHDVIKTPLKLGSIYHKKYTQ